MTNEHDTKELLNDLVDDLEQDQLLTERELVEKAKGLIHSLEGMIKQIEEGNHINNLGVVQGRGSDIDRLCAIREQIAGQIVVTKHIIEEVTR